MKRKSDMKQTSNAIVIQPIIAEEQIVTQAPVKNEEFCHTNKTKSISLKQRVKIYVKRTFHNLINMI